MIHIFVNQTSLTFITNNFPFLVILNCFKQCLTRSPYQILAEDQPQPFVTSSHYIELFVKNLLCIEFDKFESGQFLMYRSRSAKNRANLIYFVITVQDYVEPM